MNLNDSFSEKPPIQTKKLFTASEGVTSIRLTEGAILKEHVSKVPALLVCVSGEINFVSDTNEKQTLLQGDFVNILPDVKHLFQANQDSILLLIK